VHRFERLGGSAAAEAFLEEWSRRALTGPLVFDLSQVAWLDSMELGVLLELAKSSRRAGFRLIVLQPHLRLKRLIESCRLDAYLDLAATLADAAVLLEQFNAADEGRVELTAERLRFTLPRELTAAGLDGFRACLNPVLEGTSDQRVLQRIEIDAAALDFLDSAAIGLLAALKRRGQELGAEFVCTGFHGKALQILKVARIDRVLLREENAT
jgi:anti-anti-sigma factor